MKIIYSSQKITINRMEHWQIKYFDAIFFTVIFLFFVIFFQVSHYFSDTMLLKLTLSLQRPFYLLISALISTDNLHLFAHVQPDLNILQELYRFLFLITIWFDFELFSMHKPREVLLEKFGVCDRILGTEITFLFMNLFLYPLRYPEPACSGFRHHYWRFHTKAVQAGRHRSSPGDHFCLAGVLLSSYCSSLHPLWCGRGGRSDSHISEVSGSF